MAAGAGSVASSSLGLYSRGLRSWRKGSRACERGRKFDAVFSVHRVCTRESGGRYRGTARGFAPSAAVLAQWRRARRLSLKEVLAEADAGAEFAWWHALEGRIAARLREAR